MGRINFTTQEINEKLEAIPKLVIASEMAEATQAALTAAERANSIYDEIEQLSEGLPQMALDAQAALDTATESLATAEDACSSIEGALTNVRNMIPAVESTLADCGQQAQQARDAALAATEAKNNANTAIQNATAATQRANAAAEAAEQATSDANDVAAMASTIEQIIADAETQLEQTEATVEQLNATTTAIASDVAAAASTASQALTDVNSAAATANAALDRALAVAANLDADSAVGTSERLDAMAVDVDQMKPKVESLEARMEVKEQAYATPSISANNSQIVLSIKNNNVSHNYDITRTVDIPIVSSTSVGVMTPSHLQRLSNVESNASWARTRADNAMTKANDAMAMAGRNLKIAPFDGHVSGVTSTAGYTGIYAEGIYYDSEKYHFVAKADNQYYDKWDSSELYNDYTTNSLGQPVINAVVNTLFYCNGQIWTTDEYSLDLVQIAGIEGDTSIEDLETAIGDIQANLGNLQDKGEDKAIFFIDGISESDLASAADIIGYGTIPENVEVGRGEYELWYDKRNGFFYGKDTDTTRNPNGYGGLLNENNIPAGVLRQYEDVNAYYVPTDGCVYYNRQDRQFYTVGRGKIGNNALNTTTVDIPILVKEDAYADRFTQYVHIDGIMTQYNMSEFTTPYHMSLGAASRSVPSSGTETKLMAVLKDNLKSLAITWTANNRLWYFNLRTQAQAESFGYGDVWEKMHGSFLLSEAEVNHVKFVLPDDSILYYRSDLNGIYLIPVEGDESGNCKDTQFTDRILTGEDAEMLKKKISKNISDITDIRDTLENFDTSNNGYTIVPVKLISEIPDNANVVESETPSEHSYKDDGVSLYTTADGPLLVLASEPDTSNNDLITLWMDWQDSDKVSVDVDGQRLARRDILYLFNEKLWRVSEDGTSWHDVTALGGSSSEGQKIIPINCIHSNDLSGYNQKSGTYTGPLPDPDNDVSLCTFRGGGQNFALLAVLDKSRNELWLSWDGDTEMATNVDGIKFASTDKIYFFDGNLWTGREQTNDQWNVWMPLSSSAADETAELKSSMESIKEEQKFSQSIIPVKLVDTIGEEEPECADQDFQLVSNKYAYLVGDKSTGRIYAKYDNNNITHLYEFWEGFSFFGTNGDGEGDGAHIYFSEKKFYKDTETGHIYKVVRNGDTRTLVKMVFEDNEQLSVLTSRIQTTENKVESLHDDVEAKADSLKDDIEAREANIREMMYMAYKAMDTSEPGQRIVFKLRKGATFDTYYRGALKANDNADEWFDINETEDNYYMAMVGGCRDVIDIAYINTAGKTDGFSLFSELGIKTLPISHKLDFSQCEAMGYMFRYCTELESLDVSSWNLIKVDDAYFMFADCYALKSIRGFDKVKWSPSDTGSMFYQCHQLTELDLSGLDTVNVTDVNSIRNMFLDCGLHWLTISEKFFKGRYLDLTGAPLDGVRDGISWIEYFSWKAPKIMLASDIETCEEIEEDDGILCKAWGGSVGNVIQWVIYDGQPRTIFLPESIRSDSSNASHIARLQSKGYTIA